MGLTHHHVGILELCGLILLHANLPIVLLSRLLQLRRLMSELVPTDVEVESNNDENELLDDPGEEPMREHASHSERVSPRSPQGLGDSLELTEADQSEEEESVRDRTVLLSVPCKLVRGMSLQQGKLQVSLHHLRFIPEPSASVETPTTERTTWIRDGEPEVRYTSRVGKMSVVWLSAADRFPFEVQLFVHIRSAFVRQRSHLKISP